MAHAHDVPDDQLALLSELSTDETGHSGRTLLEHLVGTRALLVGWGADDDVCAGGLFHSIYGTQVFKVQSATLDRRPDIARVIGERAEHLAYLFCVTDRRGFFTQADAGAPVLRDLVHERDVEVTPDVIGDLIEIEVANVVEQVRPEHVDERRAAHLASMLEAGGHRMSSGARAALSALQGTVTR